MATPPPATVLDHYLALGDAGAFDGLSGKIELIGGRIFIVNAGRWHARVHSNLLRLLGSPLRAAGCAGEVSPTVPMSDIDAPDPDLVFVRADAEPLPDVGTRRIVAGGWRPRPDRRPARWRSLGHPPSLREDELGRSQRRTTGWWWRWRTRPCGPTPETRR